MNSAARGRQTKCSKLVADEQLSGVSSHDALLRPWLPDYKAHLSQQKSQYGVRVESVTLYEKRSLRAREVLRRSRYERVVRANIVGERRMINTRHAATSSTLFSRSARIL